MKKLALLSICICVTTASYAGSSELLKQQCSELIKEADNVTFSAQMKLMKEFFGAMLNPDKLSELKSFKLKMNPDKQYYQESKGLGLRNIVIYMGSTKSTEEKISESEAKSRIKSLDEEMKKDYPKLMKMMKSGSVEACVEMANKLNFSIEAFLEKSQKGQSMYVERQVANNEMTLKSISLSLEKLSLDWEFVERATIKDIADILKMPDVGNLVIVTHAAQNGSIIDSEFNEVPERIFTNISPTIRSIGIYACHEELVRKKYRLDEKLVSQSSIYQERRLYTPVTITYLGAPDSAPMSGLHGFMDRLEKDLKKDSENIFSKQDPILSNDVCSIEMLSSKIVDRPGVYSVSTEEFKVIEGGYVFSLNGKLIGAMNNQSYDSKLEFPCSFLNQAGSNVIINQDYTENLKSKAKGESFSVYLSRPGHELQVILGKQFFREDRSYRSSKFTFELAD